MTKRFLRCSNLAFVMTFLLFVLPSLTQAQFNYATDNGTLAITKYTGPGGMVNIPGVIDRLPVTSIGDFVFASYASLTGVVIPDSVISMGERAFYDCSALSRVTIGSGVTSIGDEAFDRCPKLSSIAIDGLNSVYKSALEAKTSPFGLKQTVTTKRLDNNGAGHAGGYTRPPQVESKPVVTVSKEPGDIHLKEQLAGAARAIIKRAIEAMGGMEQFGKYKEAYLFKSAGVMPSGMLKDVPFTSEVAFQWPDKLKITTVYQNNGRSAVQVSTIVGNETWTTINGDFGDASLQNMQAQLKRARFNLADLLAGDSVSLILSTPETLDGIQVQVIQATGADGDQETLYFDQQTGYLVKEVRHEGTASTGRHQVAVRLKDYQQTDGGLMFPMVCDLYTDKNFTLTLKYTQVQFLKAFDESVFARPPSPASRANVEPRPLMFQGLTDKLKSMGVHIKINGVER